MYILSCIDRRPIENTGGAEVTAVTLLLQGAVRIGARGVC
jgi:hypothetical protein